MTSHDIQVIVKDLYGANVSTTLISEITEDLDAEVKSCQTRRIGAIFPIVFPFGPVAERERESELENFTNKWDAKYPAISQHWKIK